MEVQMLGANLKLIEIFRIFPRMFFPSHMFKPFHLISPSSPLGVLVSRSSRMFRRPRTVLLNKLRDAKISLDARKPLALQNGN